MGFGRRCTGPSGTDGLLGLAPPLPGIIFSFLLAHPDRHFRLEFLGLDLVYLLGRDADRAIQRDAGGPTSAGAPPPTLRVAIPRP